MHQGKISILSTGTLQGEVIGRAAERGLTIESVSFIETRSIQNEYLRQRILHLANHRLTIAFTSGNAVKSVEEHLGNTRPDWKIFCTGSTTRKLVSEFFGARCIVGSADTAGDLAEMIISAKSIMSVIFFCGDKRRDELPEKLAVHHIEVGEIEVYTSLETPRVIAGNYDGILFYSPSAVHSFFSVNNIDKQTILFAIGNTTAEEISRYSNNKIIIGKDPAKHSLAEEAILYFQALFHR